MKSFKTGLSSSQTLIAIFLGFLLHVSDVQPSQAAQYWYYCAPLAAYYPYVRSCPAPWREVIAGASGGTQTPSAEAQNSAPEGRDPTLPIPTPQAHEAPHPSGSTVAFEQGQADRQRWETWFAQQSGDTKAGAEFWAGNRSRANPSVCNDRPASSTADWTSGCFAAQQQLAASDRRRLAESDYRSGWNSPVASGPAIPTAPLDERPATQPYTTSRQDAAPEVPPNRDTPGGTAAKCKDDWRSCKDNRDVVDNFAGYYKVQSACKIEAEDHAKYGTPVWPGFWSGGAFGRFFKGTDYVTSGIAVAIEPNAQFQNGFGAMVHTTVYCKYDLRRGRVIDIEIREH